MNIIIIIADTFRADYLGCYGNDWIKTPNLDHLASEGAVFTNCYADGLPTIPARRVFHTGKSILPMKNGWRPLYPNDVTLAQVLKQDGFTSAFIVDTYHHCAGCGAISSSTNALTFFILDTMADTPV